MAIEDRTELDKLYAKLEDVPISDWRPEHNTFYTYQGGFKFILYGSADEYGNAEETGVCVMDNNEEVLVDHEHAPGLSSTFGQLVKKEMAALEKQKEEEKQRSRKKLSDFLDG